MASPGTPLALRIGHMFRITEQHADGRLVLRLEGRCAGPWVDELDACWRMVADAAGREPIVVDLTGVCSVDAAGREQLARMFRGGARFVTTGCAMSEMVREIAASSQLSAFSWKPDADRHSPRGMHGRSGGSAIDEPGEDSFVTGTRTLNRSWKLEAGS